MKRNDCDQELLKAYLAGSLTAADMKRLERHALKCESYRDWDKEVS